VSRLVLKYPEPVVSGVHGHDALFDIAPQSAPLIAASQLSSWQELKTQLQNRISGEVTVTCHPHRVGHRGCVALCFQGEKGRTDILITISGRTQFPCGEEYHAPRWYIDVVDMVDAFYLVLWLGETDLSPVVAQAQNVFTAAGMPVKSS